MCKAYGMVPKTKVDDETREFLKALPKCEHHVHLEGTLSPELLFQLVEKNNVKLPSDFPENAIELHKRYLKFTGLDDFLEFYYIGMSALVTKEDFENLAYDYFVRAHEDNVHNAEVFFDPQAHTERGIDLETVVEGFTAGRRRAEATLGITTKLIMCLLKHLPVASSVKTVHDAHHHVQMGKIHGIGLDSSEKNNNPLKYKDVFDTAKTLNWDIKYTAHAGEEGPSHYVKEALDHLEVDRVDHGVTSANDPALLERLARTQTLLTVCPLSNLKLRVIDDISELPIPKLLEAGVPFSINGDDPAYFGGYCLDNYIIVHEHFNLDRATWCSIAEAGIRGSWITKTRRDELLGHLEKVREIYVPIAS